MGTIYENITNLCNERGIKPGKMCGDLALSRSLMSDLKMGRKNGITDKTAVKIANYFNVSIDRVIGGAETKKSPTTEGEGITKEQIKIALFGDDAGDISDEDLDNAVQFARFAARERKQRGDNK